MPEISRTVIRKAQKEGIEQLFLDDPLLFRQRLLEGKIRQFNEVVNSGSEMVFFDRGIPDIHGYMDYKVIVVPEGNTDHRVEFILNSL